MSEDARRTMLVILHEAIRSEEVGHEYYTALAERAEDEPSRELYERLAADEQQHEADLRRRYEKLREDLDWTPFEGAPPYKFLEHFGESLPFIRPEEDHEEPPDPGGPIEEAIRFAMGHEREAVQFFLQAAVHMRDIEAKEFFMDLARFEIHHVKLLEREMARVAG